MSEEEVPFRSIKITLSEEAMKRLDAIIKQASFRSYSSGIEECIRAVFDVMIEMHSVIGDRGERTVYPTADDESQAFRRIGMRMSRFTGRSIIPRNPRERSAGP